MSRRARPGRRKAAPPAAGPASPTPPREAEVPSAEKTKLEAQRLKTRQKEAKDLVGKLAKQGSGGKAKPRAIVLTDLNETTRRPMSYAATVAVKTLGYAATGSTIVLAYFKEYAAQGSDQQFMEQLYKYLQTVIVVGAASAVLVFIVLKALAKRNRDAMDVVETGAKHAGIEVGVYRSSRGTFAPIVIGVLLAAAAHGVALLLGAQYPTVPEFPIELTRKINSTLAEKFPWGTESFGTVNTSGFTPGPVPELVPYKPNTTIVDLATADRATQEFLDAAAHDFAQPLANVTTEVYQNLVDRVNAQGVKTIEFTGGRKFAKVDVEELSRLTDISWDGNGTLVVDIGKLYAGSSVPIDTAFLRAMKHPNPRNPDPGWTVFGSGLKVVGGAAQSAREWLPDGVGEYFDSAGRKVEEYGQDTLDVWTLFDPDTLETVTTEAVERAIRIAPAVRFAGTDPDYRTIVEGRMYPTRNMAMVELARLARSQTDAARAQVDLENSRLLEERAQNISTVEGILAPSVGERDERKQRFYDHVTESIASTTAATALAGALLLEHANRTYWPSSYLKMTLVKVRRAGTEDFDDIVCLPILAEAWNSATDPSNEVFLDVSQFEVSGVSIPRDGTKPTLKRVELPAGIAVRSSVRKNRIVDAYNEIKAQVSEDAIEILGKVLSNSDELELQDGRYWLRMALYERVRADKTPTKYIDSVKDSLFEIVKMGRPAVTVKGRPRCCIRVSNGACYSRNRASEEHTLLFCSRLPGGNKLVAALEPSRSGIDPVTGEPVLLSSDNVEYDALYYELANDGSSYYICQTCLTNDWLSVWRNFEYEKQDVLAIAVQRDEDTIGAAEARLEATLDGTYSALRALPGGASAEATVEPAGDDVYNGSRGLFD